MKIKFIFAWYDLWIGLFWDSKKKWLYVLPLPMVGFIIKLRWEEHHKCSKGCVENICDYSCTFHSVPKIKGFLK